MTVERLQPNDKRVILIAIVVAVASVIYIANNYQAAFPQASIDLQYSKNEITERARNFVAQQGLSTEGFRNLTLFDPDESARFYLERELGLEQANRLMQGEVSVWRWRARWFRPPEKEELVVYYSPQGRMVGFRHVIPEAAPDAKLSGEAARALAEEFLKKQTAKPHRLIEQQLQERPARHDHFFTWEQQDFRAKDATYRRTIVIQGDRVGEYAEFLHVPEQWERDFAALRSSNELFQWIAEALFVLLAVAAIGVLILSLRRREIPWRPLILLCSAVGVLMIVNELNGLPFQIDQLPTSSPYRDMVFFGVLQAFGAGVGVFFYVILAGAAGEPLYRRSNPSHLSIPVITTRRVLRTRKFFLACVTGYGFAAGHIAFVVAFYLVGRKFGAWSPQDVKYSDLLSTSLPWLYPLTISLLAATSEEFWFRLFAIPLLKRYLRSTWIAVLLPAFVWGFLHSNYPQQPGFLRGIEVGVIGVAAGFLMLRYGILATLIWHYTVDAVLIGSFLFESGDWYFRLSGMVVAGAIVFPLAISLILYWRNGGFETDEALLGSSVTTAEPPGPEVIDAVVDEQTEPIRATWGRKPLYLAAAVALVLGLAARPFVFGDFVEVRISASEAATRADEALRRKNVDPASWRRVAEFVTNLNVADFEYVRRAAGPSTANTVVRDNTIAGVWLVRYFRPMQSEEWRVYVGQSGAAYRMDHVLDEKAAGARLDQNQALDLATSHLTGVQQLPLSDYRQVDSNERKFDHRTDHEFVWEHVKFRIQEATARVSLSVVGDQISQYRRFLKLPEAWVREFSRPRLQVYVVPAMAGAIGLPLLVVFIRQLSARRAGSSPARWKIYVAAGVAASLATLLSSVNGWRNVLLGYDTAKPLQNYLSQAVLNVVIVAVVSGLGIFLLALAADVFLRLAAGGRTLPRPSLAAAVCVTLLIWGVPQALSYMEQLVPGDRLSLPLWRIPDPDTYVPAASVISQALLPAIAVLSMLVILIGATVRYARNRNGYLLIGACVTLAALGRATNVPQFAFHLFEGAVFIGLLIFVVRTCGADLVAFGVALFWTGAIKSAGALATQPAAQLRWNGVAALLLALALGWMFLRWMTHSRSHSPVVGL